MLTAADMGASFLDGPKFDPSVSFASFEKHYAKLAVEQAVTCATIEKELSVLPAPHTVIMDVSYLNPFQYNRYAWLTNWCGSQAFLQPCFQTVRKLSKKHVKAIAFCPGASNFVTLPFAPEEFGGVPDVRAKIMEEVSETGKSLEEVADKVCVLSHALLVPF